MAKRLNVLVKNCGNCPNANYMPLGTPVWLCFGTITKNGQPAVLGSSDYDTIPSWCPLPDDVPTVQAKEEQPE